MTDAAGLSRQRKRERILAQASVHGMVAVQIGEFAQSSVGKRDDQHTELTEREPGSDLFAAWLRSRIDELDRLIAQQTAAGWHLRDSRRLRQLIGAG